MLTSYPDKRDQSTVLPSVLRYSFGKHIFTVHTQRVFLYLGHQMEQSFTCIKVASKVLKRIKNVQDKNCVQVTSKSVPASEQFLNAVLKISISIKSGILNNTTYGHEHSTLLGSTQIHKNRCV